jgi:hypothetical protein
MSQVIVDLLTAMSDFSGENDVASDVIDQCQPRRLTARIQLQPERRCHWICWIRRAHGFQDEGERIAPPDGSLACPKQIAGAAGMHRRERLALLIHHKH